MRSSIFVPSVLCALVTSSAARLASAEEANPSASGTVLSLKTLLERVRENNEALKAARGNVDVAEGELERAWTGWQPRLNAVGSLTLNSVESKFDFSQVITGIAQTFMFPIPPGAMLPPPTVIQPHVQLNGVLTLSQTLFNITVLRAPGVARAARSAAIARTDAVQDDLLFNTATLYAAIGGLKALQAAAERAASVAQHRVRDAQVQLEAGTSTRLVLTRAETDLAVAEGQKEDLRARRKGLVANLGALIAEPGEFDVASTRITEFVGTATTGYEARTSIIARMREVDAAEKAIGLSNMSWLPTLSAEGRLVWSNVEGFAGDKVIATGTLNLVFPLYDAGVRYADTHIAEARAQQARHALEQERLAAQAYLADARSALEGARAQLAQAEAQLRLATAAVKQTEDLYTQGLATNLELTDADSRRFQADQLVVQKQLEVDIAALRTYYASGGKLLEAKERK